MKDTIYFRHDFNAHSDTRIKKLRMRHGMAGYGFYWYVIELCRAETDGKLPAKELSELLAYDLNMNQEEVKAILNTLVGEGLLVMEGKGDAAKLYSERLLRDIEHMHGTRIKNQENGKKGGRPKTQTKPTGFENETQPKPKQKANSIVEDSTNKKEKKKEDNIGEYRNEDGMPIFTNDRLFCKAHSKYYHLMDISPDSMVELREPGEQPIRLPLSECSDDLQYATDLVAPIFG